MNPARSSIEWGQEPSEDQQEQDMAAAEELGNLRQPNLSTHDFWHGLFATGPLNTSEASNSRLRIAWRLTRTLAIFQGRIELTSEIEDARTPSLQMALLPQVRTHLLEEISTNAALLDIPLLPPYKNPTQLRHWINGLSVVSNYLNCECLLPEDPLPQANTFWGLLDPKHAYDLFPSIFRLATYERALTQKVLHLTVQHGTTRAYKYLRTKLFFTHSECKMLISMARREARSEVEYDQEEERAMMTLRLQEVQRRAKKQFNLREELNAMKQEALVRGLTKTQPEGFLDVFANVVKNASQQDQTLKLTQAQPRTDLDEENNEAQD